MSRRFFAQWAPGLFAVLALGVLSAQAQTVTGTVTDAASGEPLAGVNVVVQAATVGTNTDVDGRYEITLPAGSHALTFSFVGYRTEEVEVPAGATRLDVRLREDVLGLEEVVVSGIATSVKRANLAHAVETISARELTDVTTNQTFGDALSGKVTGGTVTSYTGAPGGGFTMRLRGITTINGESQPLFIVDGIIVNNDAIQNNVDFVTLAGPEGQNQPANRIADINPEDVESVEILKGPSAAAIYGAHASNGVVIVTTRRGRERGAPQFQLSQSVGVAGLANGIGSRRFTAESAALHFGEAGRQLFEEAGGRVIDYEEELYGRDALLTTTALTASGGTERTQFYAAGSVKDDDGIIRGTGYERQSARVNLRHRFSSRAELTATTNYVRSVARRGLTGNDNTGTTFGIALAATPAFVDLRPRPDGSYPAHPFNPSNPLQTRDLADIGEGTNRALASGRLTYNLLQRTHQTLQAVLEGGVDFFALSSSALFPRELQFYAGEDLKGASVQSRTDNRNTNLRAVLVHTAEIAGRRLLVTSQAGLTAFSQDRDNVWSISEGLVPDQTSIHQASRVRTTQARLFQDDRALFAQGEANWADRVVGTVGVRAERSTLNGDVDRFFAFPKASVAVNLAAFPFWGLEALDQLKLRAAYGESGNTAPFGSKYTSFQAIAVGDDVGLLLGEQRGSAGVQPERAREVEAGLDVAGLGGRVGLEVTGYRKVVDDLILQREVETSTGFTLETFNGGQLTNDGLELALSVVPVEGDRFRWVSRTAFWTNRATMTELDVPPFRAVGGGFGVTLGSIEIEEGRSPTRILGIDDRFVERFDENGNVVFREPGQDGVPDGVYPLGDVAPDFQVSFSNEVVLFRNLRLSAFAHWKKGGDNLNLTETLGDIFGTSADYDDPATYTRYVPEEEVPALMGRVGDGLGESVLAASCTASDYGGFQRCEITDLTGDLRAALLGVSAVPVVQDASFLKLREVGLYYTIPARLLGGLAPVVRGLRVGVSAQNLLTVTPYKSYDPEVNNFGVQPVATGVELAPFPSSRSYFFHLSFGF